ncbi:hypothetical protein GYH30_044473 [Glycine max]|uniref:General negative regulator of transcription subunit 4 n=1 Tax=Glycine soja TaxID=3848 RepID=A0A445GFS8_GLYSO|nr:hypothetical protein JHK87_044553 [Glycine soja]KAH1150479.1 hypothetical protein GYH30_044473 [Glycine max]RZB60089.1 General negative regulator of transcription subunit 4 [Glycine soja]
MTLLHMQKLKCVFHCIVMSMCVLVLFNCNFWIFLICTKGRGFNLCICKACFGTTKYCHAWLRNMPCSNPDCLYLHEIGSQEDSFTKYEIISVYTRYFSNLK